jgi:hypothetical protein
MTEERQQLQVSTDNTESTTRANKKMMKDECQLSAELGGSVLLPE